MRSHRDYDIRIEIAAQSWNPIHMDNKKLNYTKKNPTPQKKTNETKAKDDNGDDDCVEVVDDCVEVVTVEDSNNANDVIELFDHEAVDVEQNGQQQSGDVSDVIVIDIVKIDVIHDLTENDGDYNAVAENKVDEAAQQSNDPEIEADVDTVELECNADDQRKTNLHTTENTFEKTEASPADAMEINEDETKSNILTTVDHQHNKSVENLNETDTNVDDEMNNAESQTKTVNIPDDDGSHCGSAGKNNDLNKVEAQVEDDQQLDEQQLEEIDENVQLAEEAHTEEHEKEITVDEPSRVENENENDAIAKEAEAPPNIDCDKTNFGSEDNACLVVNPLNKTSPVIIDISNDDNVLAEDAPAEDAPAEDAPAEDAPADAAVKSTTLAATLTKDDVTQIKRAANWLKKNIEATAKKQRSCDQHQMLKWAKRNINVKIGTTATEDHARYTEYLPLLEEILTKAEARKIRQTARIIESFVSSLPATEVTDDLKVAYAWAQRNANVTMNVKKTEDHCRSVEFLDLLPNKTVLIRSEADLIRNTAIFLRRIIQHKIGRSKALSILDLTRKERELLLWAKKNLIVAKGDVRPEKHNFIVEKRAAILEVAFEHVAFLNAKELNNWCKEDRQTFLYIDQYVKSIDDETTRVLYEKEINVLNQIKAARRGNSASQRKIVNATSQESNNPTAIIPSSPFLLQAHQSRKVSPQTTPLLPKAIQTNVRTISTFPTKDTRASTNRPSTFVYPRLFSSLQSNSSISYQGFQNYQPRSLFDTPVLRPSPEPEPQSERAESSGRSSQFSVPSFRPPSSMKISQSSKRPQSVPDHEEDQEASCQSNFRYPKRPRFRKRIVPAGYIELAILDVGPGNGTTLPANWRKVQEALINVYGEVLEANPGPPPVCREVGWLKGRAKLVACADRRSVRLYRHAIERLGEIWPGARLRIVPKSQIASKPRSRAWLPAEPSTPQEILNIIRLSNPTLPTNNWKVAKLSDSQGYHQSRQATIILNPQCLKALLATKGEINYGFGSIFIKIYRDDMWMAFKNDGQQDDFVFGNDSTLPSNQNVFQDIIDLSYASDSAESDLEIVDTQFYAEDFF